MQEAIGRAGTPINGGSAQSGSRVMVEARAVSKHFGSGEQVVKALDAVSVGIGEGEFFTLLGPSGCGKTTLLRLIAGFEHPTAGAILLDGADISGLPPFRRPVNTVFQSYALFPHLTVAENIGFGLEMLGRPKAEIAETVAEMLQMVRMEAMRDRQTSQLSGGQQQRVALARALAPRPKVLLLDEPLSALDLKLRKEMQVELKRLQTETGITFVFVTHDQGEALAMSDRIAVMSEGNVLQVGSPTEIYEHPADHFVASFIGETNFLTAAVEGVDGGQVRLRLGGTLEVRAGLPDGMAPGPSVTVVVRPEHLRIADRDAGEGLPATVSDVVYLGTDTHYHLRLAGGEELFARVQNRPEGGEAWQVGDAVSAGFPPAAVRVLRD